MPTAQELANLIMEQDRKTGAGTTPRPLTVSAPPAPAPLSAARSLANDIIQQDQDAAARRRGTATETVKPLQAKGPSPELEARARLGNDRFNQIDAEFRNKGISTFAWAHNVLRESGGNPNAVGDGGRSHGLFQFNFGGGVGSDLERQYGKARALEIARDPVLAARVMAARARAAGVHTIADPQQQALAFTERVERPASTVVQQARAELAPRPGNRMPAPRVAMNLDQLLGTVKPPPTTTTRRNNPLDQHLAFPTTGQLAKQAFGNPLGITGKEVARSVPERIQHALDPAYRYAGPDTFNPATWDVHRGRREDELWKAYVLAALTPIGQGRAEKLKTEYSGLEKQQLAAAPPLLSGGEAVKSRQLAEIRQVKGDFDAYVQRFGKEFSRKYRLAQEQATTDLNLGRSPAERHAADERWNAKRQALFAELAEALAPQRVRQEMYRRGHQLTKLQKQALDSAADYTLHAAITDEKVAFGLMGDVLVNGALGKFGEWAASALATKFPWLSELTAKATARLAILEGESEGAKTLLKRGAKQVIERTLPGEHAAASGFAGNVQQPVTYLMTDDHPTASGVVREAAIGLTGGVLGERVFHNTLHGAGAPGRWLTQWAEANPEVHNVRTVLSLLTEGEIRFPNGASKPVFSPKALQALHHVEQAKVPALTDAEPVVQRVVTTQARQVVRGDRPAVGQDGLHQPDTSRKVVVTRKGGPRIVEPRPLAETHPVSEAPRTTPPVAESSLPPTAPGQKPGAASVARGGPGASAHPSSTPEGGTAHQMPPATTGEGRPMARPQVQVNGDGRVHVEGYGHVEPHDAAALAALEDAHRSGGPEAGARVVEALPSEQRQRLAGLARDLEQHGTLGDVAQAAREHAAVRDPDAGTPVRGHGEGEPGLRPTEPRRTSEAESAAWGEREQTTGREASTPEDPHSSGNAAAELDAATSAWEREHGGKRYGGAEPDAVGAARPVARALLRAGVAPGDALLNGLWQHLGPGHGEEFYRAVASAVEHKAGPRTEVPSRTGGSTAASGAPAPGGRTTLPGPAAEGTPATSGPQGERPALGPSANGQPATAPSAPSGSPGLPEAPARAEASGPTAGAAGSTERPASTEYGHGNRAFTPKQADAARGRLAPKLPELQDGRPVERFKQARPDLLALGSFHYEAGARQIETWRARLQAEIGADTLSKTQLNELWQATKTRTNKALNVAARDGAGPPLSPTFSRSASSTAPEFSSGAVVVSVPAETVRLRGPAGENSLRDDLLHHLEAGLTPDQLQVRLRSQGHDLSAAAQELRQLKLEGRVFTEGQGARRIYRTTPAWKPGEAGIPGRVTPEARRALVRQARAATEPVELWDTLRQLGLENPTTPEAQAALEQWGLKKHVNDWLNPPVEGMQTTIKSNLRRLSKPGAINPLLRRLKPDQYRLWTEPEAIRQVAWKLYSALNLPEAERRTVMRELDEVIGAGMEALNFPRNRPTSVDLEALDVGVACKRENCDLRIDPFWLYDILKKHKCPGALWQTWIHESIHARLGFFKDWRLELGPHQGYEDGFAEMLARGLSMEQGRLTILSGSYDYYTEAYEMLVRAAEIDKHKLWLKLYKCEPGTIRSRFPDILEELTGKDFSNQQKLEITTLADELFAFDNWDRKTSLRTAHESHARWRKVLR